MDAGASVRRSGSAALDLAWVAAGRYDGFWQRGLSPWDMAAGIVIGREAGALVSDTNDRAEMFATGTIVAGNAVHPSRADRESRESGARRLNIRPGPDFAVSLTSESTVSIRPEHERHERCCFSGEPRPGNTILIS